LTSRLKENRLTVLDKIELEQPKTRNFLEVCKQTGLDAGKAIFVTADKDEMLERSSRNVHRYMALPCDGLNVYDLLRFERLVIFKDAVSRIHERLGR
jgi:large subunit ribosomal protein L4